MWLAELCCRERMERQGVEARMPIGNPLNDGVVTQARIKASRWDDRYGDACKH